MGAFSQLGLLLWKNIKLRQRSPVLTGVQLLWPLILFSVIAVLRMGNQPIENGSCNYSPKALPSSGLMPFMQSFICDVENTCHDTITTPDNQVPTYAGAQISVIVTELNELFTNTSLMDEIKDLSYSIEPLNDLKDLINDGIKNLTNKQYRFGDLFHDEKYIKNYLVRQTNMTEETVMALMNATVNVNRIFELMGYTDFKGIVCNETALERYLQFEEGANVSAVVDALCHVNDSQIAELVEEIQRQLDIRYIISELTVLLDLIGSYDWDQILSDLDRLLEGLNNTADIAQFLKDFPAMLEFIDLIPQLQKLYEAFTSGILDLETELFEHIIDSFDALLGNDTVWFKIKSGLRQIRVILELFNDQADEPIENDVILGNLFGNNSAFFQIIDDYFEDTPNVSLALLNAMVSPDMLMFVIKSRSVDRAVWMLCNDSLSDIFTFTDGVDEEYVQNALCSGNVTQLMTDLLQNLDMAQLVRELTQYNPSPGGMFDIDWNQLYDEVKTMIDGLQYIPMDMLDKLPEFLQSLSDLNLGSWNDLAQGLRNTNATYAGRLHNISGIIQDMFPIDPAMFELLNILVPILENPNITLEEKLDTVSKVAIGLFADQMQNSSFLLPMQKGLILQNLMYDMILTFTEKFVGERWCPETWIMEGASCYKTVQNEATLMEAIDQCQLLYAGANLVSVNDEYEQKMLEEIGKPYSTWIGARPYPGGAAWLDGTNSSYSNWMTGDHSGNCVVANFGTDGFWEKKNCTSKAEGFLCEAKQGPPILRGIRENPFVELLYTILDLGPEVSIAILDAFSSSSLIEQMSMPGFWNSTGLFCDDVIQYPETVNITVVKEALCSFNIHEMVQRVSEEWDFWQELEMYIEVWNTKITDLTPEQLQYANLSAIFLKADLVQAHIEEITMNPTDWEALFWNIFSDVNMDSMEAIIAQYSWQQPASMEEGIGMMMYGLGSVLESTDQWAMYEPFFLYSYYEMQILLKQNEWIEALSRGEIVTEEPHMMKLMEGVIGLMEQPQDVMIPLMTVMSDQQFINTLVGQEDWQATFCDPVLRQDTFQFPTSADLSYFDLYLCEINVTILEYEYSKEFYVQEIYEQSIKIEQVLAGGYPAPSGEPFDWQTYFESMEKYYESQMRMQSIMMDMIAYYNLSVVMETWTPMYENVEYTANTTLFEMIGNIGKMMNSSFGGSAMYPAAFAQQMRTQTLFLKALNRHFEIMEGIANGEDVLNGTEITKFYTGLVEARDNFPAVLEATIKSLVNPEMMLAQTELMAAGNDWVTATVFSICQAVDYSNDDITMFTDIFCKVNWTLLIEDMKKEMYLNEFITMFAPHPLTNFTYGWNSTVSNYSVIMPELTTIDWEEYWYNQEKLNENINNTINNIIQQMSQYNTSFDNMWSGMWDYDFMNDPWQIMFGNISKMMQSAFGGSAMYPAAFAQQMKTQTLFLKALNRHFEIMEGIANGEDVLNGTEITKFYTGLVEAMENFPAMLEATIKSLNDPEMMLTQTELMAAGNDWITATVFSICQAVDYSNDDITMFRDVFCKVNWTLLIEDMKKEMYLNEFITMVSGSIIIYLGEGGGRGGVYGNTSSPDAVFIPYILAFCGGF
uniref:Uncharacterized protein LOC100378128 n=1 Tax=Saccoglossus kowalevskii TaxID=10224 RepID=A0ABM0GUR9_SACKO|nr:PREDICTED: uncharacterized protein LOC100378128 [Saccoglossus kowalevskii]